MAVNTGSLYNPELWRIHFSGITTGKPVASCIGERQADAIGLVKKYNPNRSDALFFMPGSDDPFIVLYSKHRNRLGYTAMTPHNFPLLHAEIERRLRSRPSGKMPINADGIYRGCAWCRRRRPEVPATIICMHLSS